MFGARNMQVKMMFAIYTGYMEPQETVVIPVSGDDYIEIVEAGLKHSLWQSVKQTAALTFCGIWQRE